MHKSLKFNTPDGTRYATVIDGARVTGDAPPSGQAVDAIRELLAVARKRFGTSDMIVTSPHHVSSVNGEEVFIAGDLKQGRGT